jgi:anti-sigma-K factor RskA
VSSSDYESLHALSGAYAVDALDDDERAAFEQHLLRCEDCREEVAGLREAAALMADDAAVTPPDSLRASVLSGIRSIRPLPPETGRSAETGTPHPVAPEAGSNVVPMRSRRGRIATLLTAAAAILVIAGGVAWQPWQDDSTSTTVSAADRVLRAEDAQKVSIDFEDGSSATVVRSLEERRAVVLTRDMAAPPPGKAFELWLQDDSGKMLPAGLMKTAGDHKVLLEGDAAEATGVGITVEPASGSEEPTSEPIALFDLSKASA